jgi:MerR family transcriptional regulator, copper efflux regulator
MQIGEVVRRSGIPRDTVRLYTRLGLLPASTRTAGSREYAEYPESTIQLLAEIRTTQSLGFTLAQIKVLGDDYARGSLDDETQRTALTAKLIELRAMQTNLAATIQLIEHKLEQLGPDDSAG